MIGEAIKKMKPKLSRIGKRNVETIKDLCSLGDDLNDLHAKCKPGKWLVRVEKELELDKTTVHRLRTLASSTLRDQMALTIGQHLQRKLPSEIQKLVILTNVPADKFSEFLARFNPSEMTREELREAVDGKPASKDGKSNKRTAYNGHFECKCYHPLFCFNQFGDLERALLREGQVHSADD